MAVKILFYLLSFFFFLFISQSVMAVYVAVDATQTGEENKPTPKPDASERDRSAIPSARIALSRKERTMKSSFDGSCPVCRLGEVESGRCKDCGAEFCAICGGLQGRASENVSVCGCTHLVPEHGGCCG